MRTPNPDTYLALRLAHASIPSLDGRTAGDATRAVDICKAIRRSYELGCNQQLTPRQENRQAKLEERADVILAPYGLKIGNPWGLCIYAIPLRNTDNNPRQDDCVFLA